MQTQAYTVDQSTLYFVLPTEYGTMTARMWRNNNDNERYPALTGYTIWFHFGNDDRDPNQTPLTVNKIAYRTSVYSWETNQDGERTYAGQNYKAIHREGQEWESEPTVKAFSVIYGLMRQHAETILHNPEYRSHATALAIGSLRDRFQEKAQIFQKLANDWTAQLLDHEYAYR